MDTLPSRSRLHPVIWLAALSVTALSAVGIGAITGWIPVAGGHQEILGETRMAAAQASASETAGTGHPDARKPASSAPAPSSAPQRAQIDTRRAPPADEPAPMVATRPPACADCGVIESVRSVQSGTPASGVGVIAGGVIGGVLGNQVGKGSGRDLATIGGAVLGGIAGNQVEKRVRTTSTYEIAVRMDNGDRTLVHSAQLPGWREGERVSVRDGGLHPPPTAH